MRILQKLFITGITLASFSGMAEISVIVNNDNASTLDEKLVKRIYLGKAKSFPAGGKVTALTLKDDAPVSEAFRQNVLKKSNSQYKSHWSKLAFTGKGTPPTEVSSESEMISTVKSDVTAIGFVDSASVTSDVKVVARF
jgi:ABC-type phosphate transport system substrate-binding protein